METKDISQQQHPLLQLYTPAYIKSCILATKDVMYVHHIKHYGLEYGCMHRHLCLENQSIEKKSPGTKMWLHILTLRAFSTVSLDASHHPETHIAACSRGDAIFMKPGVETSDRFFRVMLPVPVLRTRALPALKRGAHSRNLT